MPGTQLSQNDDDGNNDGKPAAPIPSRQRLFSAPAKKRGEGSAEDEDAEVAETPVVSQGGVVQQSVEHEADNLAKEILSSVGKPINVDIQTAT